ncbi:MAG: hypothetical protein R3F61_34270 [Myxococcota bacterium]
MNTEALVAQLSQLGLSRTQSLVWLALLRDDSRAVPAGPGDSRTGLLPSEVAARAGVPDADQALSELTDLGAAFPVDGRYFATELGGWMSRARQRSLENIANLEAALSQLPPPSRPEPLWTLRDYDHVMTRAERMIRAATESIYLHLWPREVERVWPALQAVADRPLHRVLYTPAPLDRSPPGIHCWTDTLKGNEDKANWAHRAIIVVDRREALTGGAEPGRDNAAVWTQNRTLVDLATNHIILDITLLARRRGVDPNADVGAMMRPQLD